MTWGVISFCNKGVECHSVVRGEGEGVSFCDKGEVILSISLTRSPARPSPCTSADSRLVHPFITPSVETDGSGSGAPG